MPRPVRRCGLSPRLGARSGCRGTGAGQYNKRPTGRGAPVGPRALERTQLRPLNARHLQGGRRRRSTSRIRVRSAVRGSITISKGHTSLSTFRKTAVRRAPRILHRINSGKSGVASSLRPPQLQTSAQKKAQPGEVALKVPPKEEVLEERVGTWRRRTQKHYALILDQMQAFAAALQHAPHHQGQKMFSMNQTDREPLPCPPYPTGACYRTTRTGIRA